MDPYTQLLPVRKKRVRQIAELMSDTPTDGVTVAITEIRGAGSEIQVKLLEFHTFR